MLNVRSLAISILCFAITFSFAQAADEFRWITEQNEPAFYKILVTAFRPELQKHDSNTQYYPKSFARIGCYVSSCLVVIDTREKGVNDPEHYFYRAFSYDINKRTKKEISVDHATFWNWSLLNVVSFEPATIDIVFKYLSCRECEPAELLTSFVYEKTTASWNTRVWPDNDPHILIGAADQYGDGIIHYDCLHSLRDVDHDGFADIAVRCRVTEDPFEDGEKRLLEDRMVIYGINKGLPKKTEIVSKRERKRIMKILCEGNTDNRLCAK